MDKSKIGYAVLGLGIGMAHADAAYASSHARLVAVCDCDEEKIQKALKRYENIKAYASATELFADDEVDVISICLPSGMHAEYAIQAMEAGKHVLIEKPIDILPSQAHLIEETRIRTGKKVGVVHQNRFNCNMYPIKDAIDSGRLGRLILGTFAVKWYREQAYYDRGGWRGTWDMDGGGSLINQAIHTVDLMQWLMGDVESVTSTMDICNHEIETEDLTASLIKFKNGATATFVSTTCAYPGISTEICLYGTGGSVEADADVLKLWKMRDAADEDDEEAKMLSIYGNGNIGYPQLHEPLIFGHAHVVEDMIMAVRDDRDPEISPVEATKSLAIIHAIYQSAKTHQTVYLDGK